MSALSRVRSAWTLLGALRPNRLKVEVRAHLPILPVLRGQLAETARQVEDAVVGVCRSFSGMAARARETVGGASELLSGGTTGDKARNGVESLIDLSHATILHLLERMERNRDLSLSAVRRMEEVEAAMRRIAAALSEVDRIAFTNKLLALNAKIESVHVGELGAGFGVVADQISLQAQRSNELTEQMGIAIRGVSQAAAAAAGELRQTASADTDMLAQSRREAEDTLDGLRRAHAQARQALASIAETNSSLANDISRAIVGLQFQDRVNQRISHVIEALESMESALSNRLPAGRETGENRRIAVEEGLRDSYTMESERTVLAGAPAGVAADSAEGDVELF